MPRSKLLLAGLCLPALIAFAQCAAPSTGQGGSGGSTGNGGSSSTGGASASGGTTGTGGSASGGNTGSGGSTSTGGTTGTGGAKGGTTGTGGTVATGGSTGSGGTTGTGGAKGGTTGTGGTSSGGTTGTGGTSSGGTTGTGGASTTDANGVALATTSSGCLSGVYPNIPYYFNLGDMRLINNRWGSVALNCPASSVSESVCVNSDKSLSWKFSRGGCGETNHSDPDFPEIEFGVAPFGTTSSNLTSPNFSSTTLLPIQISALNSATLSLTNYNTTFTKPTYWDANFEFWISKEDPTKNANAQVYAEIIIFLGWNSDRQTGSTTSWPCMSYNPSTISGTNLQLCHQSDTWANNQWRFFNFVATNGPLSSVSGTFDIKQILSWVMSNFANSTNSALGNFSDSMYLTRIEVGTEIDDQTSGSASVGNISFSINGTTKSPTFGP